MTQKCQHDEQLLDYVYGELSDAERKIFADHLATCNTCPAQVQSFGTIRQEFQQRTPIEPAGEAMQRMTALLMQAAAAEHGKAAAVATDGGGKVLAFRARGLRRILFHPASSVMAVAAAALFWVVFHAPPIPESGLSAPTSPTSFEAPRPTPGAATPPATVPAQAVVAKNDPRPEVAAAAADTKAVEGSRAGFGADKGSKDEQDGDFDGLRGGSRVTEKKLAEVPLAKAEPPAKPMMVAKEESYAAAGKGSGARSRADVQYRGSGPAVVAMADQAYDQAKKSAPRFEAERPAPNPTPPAAAPPPPPPRVTTAAAAKPRDDEADTSVREGLTRTQERVQQKMVDELANQALAGMNSGAASVPPVPPPANVHRYAQGGASASGSTSHGDSVENTPGPSYDYNQNEQAPTPAAAPTASAAGMPSREPVTGAAPDDNATALTAAKEQLRRGQCSEANTTLTRLERTAPQLYGLTAARADWQSACAAPAQNLERRMNLEAPESAASQLAAPKRAINKQRLASPAAPSPAKAPPRKPTKANADAL